MKALLETGVHFGHRTRKWNPKMKPFIFTERNGIHIIDLQQTLEALEETYAVVRDIVAAGGKVLFVGTKRQAQETIELEATRCGMPYVNLRWLGGMLTNWRTIRSRIDELDTLERRRDAGEFDLLTKKEALSLTRQINKLDARLGGIRDMRTLPKVLFVVDVRQEATAIHEANLLNIPVVALVDTNCDPGNIDYIIPSNDDAIRAIKLLTSKIADASLEGIGLRKDDEEELGEEGATAPRDEGGEMSDEDLLGEATLAKLKSGAYSDQEAEKVSDADDGDKVEDLPEEAEVDDQDSDDPEAEDEADDDDSSVDESDDEDEDDSTIDESDDEDEDADDADADDDDDSSVDESDDEDDDADDDDGDEGSQ
jgi:small subunit ribosomal protein S2